MSARAGANFVTDPIHEATDRVTLKIRYKSPEVGATMTLPDDTGAFEVRFDEPQRAVTPGQAVVIYREDQMIGGGVVDEAVREETCR